MCVASRSSQYKPSSLSLTSSSPSAHHECHSFTQVRFPAHTLVFYFQPMVTTTSTWRETKAQRKADIRRDALAVRERQNTVTSTTGSSTRWRGRLNGLDVQRVGRRSACTVRCNPVCVILKHMMHISSHSHTSR